MFMPPGRPPPRVASGLACVPDAEGLISSSRTGPVAWPGAGPLVGSRTVCCASAAAGAAAAGAGATVPVAGAAPDAAGATTAAA